MPRLPGQVEAQQRDSAAKRSDKLPDTVAGRSWVTVAAPPALLLGWRGWAALQASRARDHGGGRSCAPRSGAQRRERFAKLGFLRRVA